MPIVENTLVTYVDTDGKKAARSLVDRNRDVARLVAPRELFYISFHIGNLIIVGHGSTMVGIGRAIGLSDMIGPGQFSFIILAACEVGLTHTSIGELQSIAQGLANLRDCTVWGTTRDLPKEAVANGSAFYKSPVYKWLQVGGDSYPDMWKQFGKQTAEEAVSEMFPNLNINSL